MFITWSNECKRKCGSQSNPIGLITLSDIFNIKRIKMDCKCHEFNGKPIHNFTFELILSRQINCCVGCFAGRSKVLIEFTLFV